MNIPRILVAATHSGAGKTTLATALMAAFTRAGYVVQPFKVGPDYIDPGYHLAATGRESRNLDTIFLGLEGVREVFARAALGADLCIIEGVMGLYDGRGSTERGSSAEVAKALEAPVLLLLDARSMSRSAAALALGYRMFDSGVRIAGILLNRVGSPRHYNILKEVIEEQAGVPVLGWIGHRAEISLPHRHLGLLPAMEKDALAEHLERLVAVLEEGVDLFRLLEIARAAPPLPRIGEKIFPAVPRSPRVCLGVIKDAAFNFYYQDGLELLAALGAEMVFLSALSSPALPPDLDGLYIGGGFPEMFLEKLAANRSFMESLRRAFNQGMPVYAECGGLMYICRSIYGFDGREYPMAGLLPGVCRMHTRRVALGYCKARVLNDNILAPAGTELVGHEFHYSFLEDMPADFPRAYALRREGEEVEVLDGYVRGNLLASYLHLHFASCPEAARRFVECCARFKKKRVVEC
ncbi:cobyrinate a,c-diamide synthase [Desulfofundulus thermocisternus]|uniref:cobyrinate a,c-diamide synthase n=1 Tax=Desulfofundulus thermocisternus TaxID=42471 RepID=UPI00217D5DD8|nr:cobyrinate a,c-diamide synthase [Desulfofundulus thermocisternus]MCS5695758.1 cobyrinate a,c-diamide synthase [Desulfofundulus thermocisternus]